MCRNLARVAGSKIAMLTKSDDRVHGYLRLIDGLPYVSIGVDSLSISIGRARPEAVA